MKRRLKSIDMLDTSTGEIVKLSLVKDGSYLYLYCEKCKSDSCNHVDATWMDKKMREWMFEVAEEEGLELLP